MIIISIIITAPYSTVLKRKFSDYSFFNHRLKYPVMQNPVDSPGSIFKTNPYQAETELDAKDTLFEI